MTPPVKAEVAPDPANVGLLGAVGVVKGAKALADHVQEARTCRFGHHNGPVRNQRRVVHGDSPERRLAAPRRRVPTT
jgi:hypothetical protein